MKQSAKTASEVFADRRYEANGQLVSRKESDAVITDTDAAIEQVIKMVKRQQSDSERWN